MPFQVYDWPTVILHIDGDSFFSSVIQAMRPELRGKPVVTGSERGVATAVSPEAKRLGITRATPIFEVKKRFPSCIIVSSDYQLYSLYSHRMINIVRRYSPTVEKYSIDEAFADLKGLRRPLNMTYQEIAQAIKREIESSLGISVSVGVSLTKTLAKVASGFRKPSGLVLIPGRFIPGYLAKTPIEDIWGIGPNTASYLTKLGVNTAYDFARRPEEFIVERVSKSFYEIWRELRGEMVYQLATSHKDTYKSITRSHTFTPPSQDSTLLWARLKEHVDEAFAQARSYNYHIGTVSLYLKTQEFRFHRHEVKLLTKVQYPHQVLKELREAFFTKIYHSNTPYRTSGCTISDLEEVTSYQQGLFQDSQKEDKIRKVYPILETGKVHFGSSLYEGRQLTKKKPTHFTIPMMDLKDL